MFDSDDEELEEKSEKLEKDFVSCDNSSFITDKYMEDLNAQTAANKFSDMILSFERSPEEEKLCNPDSEQAFHVEDEIYISDDELEDDDDSLEESSFSAEEIDILNQSLLNKLLKPIISS